MEPMINNGDNRKVKRIISEPTPVDPQVSFFKKAGIQIRISAI